MTCRGLERCAVAALAEANEVIKRAGNKDKNRHKARKQRIAFAPMNLPPFAMRCTGRTALPSSNGLRHEVSGPSGANWNRSCGPLGGGNANCPLC
jgi:hypothetical protein